MRMGNNTVLPNPFSLYTQLYSMEIIYPRLKNFGQKSLNKKKILLALMGESRYFFVLNLIYVFVF